jgi:uncharacterized metal-binding protein
MSEEITKIGIISCSGESIPEGTIARLAVRRVRKSLRPGKTVTLCLPLFLVRRRRAQFCKTHPTVAIDGCPKQCAKWGTEKHSGPVSGEIVVSKFWERPLRAARSSRSASQVDKDAVLGGCRKKLRLKLIKLANT